MFYSFDWPHRFLLPLGVNGTTLAENHIHAPPITQQNGPSAAPFSFAIVAPARVGEDKRIIRTAPQTVASAKKNLYLARRAWLQYEWLEAFSGLSADTRAKFKERPERPNRTSRTSMFGRFLFSAADTVTGGNTI
jgi:hypothetical protein